MPGQHGPEFPGALRLLAIKITYSRQAQGLTRVWFHKSPQGTWHQECLLKPLELSWATGDDRRWVMRMERPELMGAN